MNEERFARAYARGHFRLKQWGREKIKQQLRFKKISEYCIRKAMTEIDDADYEATVDKLFHRKLKELKGERSIPTLKGKILRFLLQKGFERDIILDKIKISIK